MSQSIVERIRKLIAHERSARTIGNVAEAEAFAAKVQTLLFEHKLSMSDVDLKSDPFGHEEAAAAKPIKRAVAWSTRLAMAVCNATFCHVVEVTGSSNLIFVGRSQDRAVAISMWTFLYYVAIRFAELDVPAIAKTRSRMSPMKIRNRFLMGFATAIYIRLRREKDESVNASGEASMVLVRKEETRLVEYKSTAFPALQQKKIANPRDSLAFRKGFMRGMQTPLQKTALLLGEGL